MEGRHAQRVLLHRDHIDKSQPHDQQNGQSQCTQNLSFLHDKRLLFICFYCITALRNVNFVLIHDLFISFMYI